MQLHERILYCARKVGNKRLLAKESGISEAQLFRYLRGKTSPNIHKLKAIATAAEIDCNWLVTGEGIPQKPAIEGLEQNAGIGVQYPELLHRSIELIEELHQEYNYHFSPDLKAKFVMAIYTAMLHEAELYAELPDFTKSKALEIIHLIFNFEGETGRQMLFNTKNIMDKAGANQLPTTELRAFINYSCLARTDFYSTESGKAYYQRMGMDLLPEFALQINGILNEISAILKNKQLRILDLGCGNGRFASYFHRVKKLAVQGVDGSSHAISLCQRLENSGYLPKGTTTLGDLRYLPYDNARFNVAFCYNTLFDFPYVPGAQYGLSQVFSEANRVLEMGGVFFINSRYGKGYEPLPFAQLLDYDDIHQLAAEHGFKVVDFNVLEWSDSIEYLPKAKFNMWFSASLQKVSVDDNEHKTRENHDSTDVSSHH